MSNLVDSWLNGIGLGYAVPIFAGQGINSPDMLSELDVVDFPELGISDQNDRKKLFYLIQRVKLALARGRAAENKAAPQADSAVSSAAPAAAGRETARAKEDNPPSSSAANSSVRFRRELEVPASRAAAPQRAGDRARNTPGSAASAGAGGAVGRLTPAKAQRLPPSHRRPKTPHADGTVRAKQQQQPPQSPGGTRTSSATAGGRVRQQVPVVGRLEAAAGSGGVAVLAVEHETSIQVFPDGGQDAGGDGYGGFGERGPPPDRPSPRPKASNKSNEQQHHRNVLEPVQLDEAGGRTRLSSSSASTAADERRSMPPPPPSAGTCAGRPDHTAVVPSQRSREVGEETPEMLSGGAAVAVVTTVPPQPPRDTQERPRGGGSGSSRRPPPRGLRDTSPRHAGGGTAASPANAATAPSLPKKEVARLKRDTASAGSNSNSSNSNNNKSSDRTARRAETSDGEENSAGGLTVDDRKAGRLTAVPRAFPSLPEVGAGTGEGDRQAAAAAAATAAAAIENGRSESAAELAMHLISAHREDVRSALAAARRDMDLVSKADKDREPAALMEYAREVEGVLGQRMAAGAKLRQALDSYLALRQAAGAAAPDLRPEGHGLQGGRRQAGARALRT
eukprot:g1339.t1